MPHRKIIARNRPERNLDFATRARGDEATGVGVGVVIWWGGLRLCNRLTPMFEIEEFAPFKPRFGKLEKKYLAGLKSADDSARDLEGAKKRKQRHEGYRRAFGYIYPDLKALLIELVEIG